LLLAGEKKRKILMKEGGLPRFGLCEQRQGGLRPPLVLSVFAPREGNGSFALRQGKALCASGSSFWFQRERGQPVQQGKRKKWGLWFVSIFFFLRERRLPRLKGEETKKSKSSFPPEGFLWFLIKGGGRRLFVQNREKSGSFFLGFFFFFLLFPL
jgi:hypothetical protein